MQIILGEPGTDQINSRFEIPVQTADVLLCGRNILVSEDSLNRFGGYFVLVSQDRCHVPSNGVVTQPSYSRPFA